MRTVYEAENLIDAHLMRGRLQAEGIGAWVLGESLVGGLGELPLGGLLSVAVDDADAELALALLAELALAPPALDGDDDVVGDWPLGAELRA